MQLPILKPATLIAALIFSLTAIFSHAPAADTPLIYAQFQATEATPDFFQITSDIIEVLFDNSAFTLKKRFIPAGDRLLHEIASNRLDLFLGATNDDLIGLLTTDIVDFHPIPVFHTPYHFYTLKDSAINPSDLTGPSNYRLGVASMPAQRIEALTKLELGSVTNYRTDIHLAKALLSQRIDIMLAIKQSSHRVFHNLEAENRINIVDLGQAIDMSLHFSLRGNMPETTKKAVFALLNERIPAFKQSPLLEMLLKKYDLVPTVSTGPIFIIKHKDAP